MKTRIAYLDIAKFIGIFSIYLGHYHVYAGFAYPFVFTFHVALFFFLSGCSERLSKPLSPGKYIIRNIRTLLVPYCLFAVMSIAFNAIRFDTYTKLVPDLLLVAKGCAREQFYAGSLWFFTCLFVVRLLFYFLKRWVKCLWGVVLICAGLCVTARCLLQSRLPFNIDSAFQYILAYAFGYLCFPVVQKWFSWDRDIKRASCLMAAAITSLCAVMVFFGKDFLMARLEGTRLEYIYVIARTGILILWVLVISRCVEQSPLMEKLGRDTLYLCGSEYIVKETFQTSLPMIGLQFDLPNPWTAYLCAFAMLMLCWYTLVPVEKKLLACLQHKPASNQT